MKGIFNTNFKLLSVSDEEIQDGTGYIDEDDLIVFDKGDEVEILKVIQDKTFISKVAYVVLNIKNNESATFDSIFIDLIKE